MRKLFCLFLFVLIGQSLLAQRKMVSGTVTSKTNGVPLQGVSVQSGNALSVTDASGNFSIESSKGQVIRFSYSGKKAHSLTWDGEAAQKVH